MVGTAGDFMTFLEAIRAGGGGILKAATVTAMTTTKTKVGAGAAHGRRRSLAVAPGLARPR